MTRFYVKYQGKYLAWFPDIERARDFIKKLMNFPDFNPEGFEIVTVNN